MARKKKSSEAASDATSTPAAPAPEAVEASTSTDLLDATATDDDLDLDSEDVGEDADDLEIVEEKPEAKPEAEAEAKPEEKVEKTAAEEPSEEKKVEEKPAEAEAKPAGETQAEEEEAPTPEAKPEEKPEAQPAPEPVQPEQQPPTLEEVQGKFTEWRDEAETLLAEHHYNLSPEQVQEMEEAQLPDVLIKGLPRLMARVYLDSVTAAMGQITTHLPQLMDMVTQQREVSKGEEGEFFDRWPILGEHRDTVIRLGAAYRQAHPAASKEDFINEVGASAMIALQLPIEGMVPEKTNGSEEEKVTPFKPAATGRPAKGAPPKKGVFETLADEFEEEDLDLD